MRELQGMNPPSTSADGFGATIRYPADLPISQQRGRIMEALSAHQVVIVAGETGSGKTTQLPKMCLEAGFAANGQIGCTQPRRVAAMSISKRVAEELDVPWGRMVGCKMRFADDTSDATKLKFMTDGILLAEVQSDPMLRKYSALIIDEAHERSLNIDFLLGYLKGLLQKRPELKLIITSATIDTLVFSEAFGGAPIVEVSGRLFPVEIRYVPVETFESAQDEGDFIGATADAVEDALLESADGDVLVFFPTERDIREARELLEGRLGAGTEVVALFGRMAGEEQQKVFTPGRKRRVILATNIAETSLTLPRIRYVVDTGLARMSRYAPRTRTKRLPVEPVSQSSANQRSGRAGRLSEGVCIRLFSQDDFEKRPKFTQPEIQRANLAEVILRMKAFKLGEIENFPFLNPPLPASIRAGYVLLHELGALDDAHEMTAQGRELAKLPLDPTLGKMLLHARQEHVLPELLVISAGLSVPDPRERPEEAREQASQAHRAFLMPGSDFLSLLKMWQLATEAGVWKSSNALRKFCKAKFLSFTRMKEWRDIHAQLSETMGLRHAENVAAMDEQKAHAVHRCILSASLGQVGCRVERNVYKSSGNREVLIFPGSNFHEKREKKGQTAEKSKQPQWLVAGEIVHTSQLFARTVAGIDPSWIVSLGAHLCEYRYGDPEWEFKSGRVLVTERILLHGLELRRSKVDYGKVDPVSATDIFIRHGLLEEPSPVTHTFYLANLRLCRKLEAMLVRSGKKRTQVIERLFDFYRQRLSWISSIHDLSRIYKERIVDDPHFLRASDHELMPEEDLTEATQLFPDQVQLGNSVLPLHYSYQPGSEHDGVTVEVPLEVAQHLTTGQVQWLVPGMRVELAGVLLRALPKPQRRKLMPMEHKIADIAQNFSPGNGDFLVALATYISRTFDVFVSAGDWPADSLPDYLKPRVAVINAKKETVAMSRDVDALRGEAQQHEIRTGAWAQAVQHWHKPDLRTWSFGDLPEKVYVETIGGVEIFGYPGLSFQNNSVCLNLFKTKLEAESDASRAIRKLAELALGKEIAWLHKELRAIEIPSTKSPNKAAGFHDALGELGKNLKSGTPLAEPTTEILQNSALEHILGSIFKFEPLRPWTEARFLQLIAEAKPAMTQMARKVEELTGQILTLRKQIMAATKRYPAWEADLARLVPPDFLAKTPSAHLQHLPRYLKAMLMRGERADLSPAKDAEKSKALAPVRDWRSLAPSQHFETIRWMMEEFRVGIFAPELGTAQPVSAKRILALME